MKMYDGNKMFYGFDKFFYAVMEMRAATSVSWIDPVKFADMFLAG